MTPINPGRVALQANIALMRVGVVPGVIALLLFSGAAAWIGFALSEKIQGPPEYSLVQSRETRHAPPLAAGDERGFAAEQNLHKFYDVLGDSSNTEKYLKALFEIAARSGLSLDQGDYRWQVDRISPAQLYEVQLPIKGPYDAIRRFCEQTLRALPFASLDGLNFKRDSIGDEEVDATVRFTFYLKDGLAASRRIESPK